MWDELNEPLGLASGAAAAPPLDRWRAAGRAAIGAAALAAAIGLVTLARRDSPLGGEPFAVAKVEIAPPAVSAAPDPGAPAHEAAAPPIASADQVEAASGVKVIRGGGGGPPNARIIDVERALAVRLDAAPDPRLIETSRLGPLPRVGADGARPFEVYARPVLLDPKLGPGAPRIALMVGGLGLNAEGDEAAIAKLPGAVTLGFAPYGAAIEERAVKAREAGHETALQAPMEDFSDRTGDPGSHMLKTSASDADNLGSLRWLMSRFTGYIAVANHLGGKFTADAKEVSPVLTEIAARGLGYLDDGASPRSVAPDVAATLAMPVGARRPCHRRQPGARVDRSRAGAAPRSRARARLGDRRRLRFAGDRRAIGPMGERARSEGFRFGPALRPDVLGARPIGQVQALSR